MTTGRAGRHDTREPEANSAHNANRADGNGPGRPTDGAGGTVRAGAGGEPSVAGRTRRWPNTANPHLFINQRTAGQTGPVEPRWIRLTLQLPPRVLREDRILDEAHARPGDAWRLCDLFGMTVSTAARFVAAVEHPTSPATPADGAAGDELMVR